MIPTQVFSRQYCEIFKKAFLYRTPPVEAPVWQILDLSIQNMYLEVFSESALYVIGSITRIANKLDL